MARRSFPIYDFVVYGFKDSLNNIRLFILTLLAFLGSMLVTALAMFVVARPFFMELWQTKLAYKQDMMTCTNVMECKSVFMGMWNDAIVPLVYAHSYSVIFCCIIALIVLSGLALGFIRIVLNLRDKKKVHVSQLFTSFYLVPKLIVSGFLAMLAIGIGLALFIIPGIFLMTRLFFFKAYLVDKDAGVIECLQKSYKATRGLEWEVLGMMIVIMMVSMLPLIGLPAAFLLFIDAYRKLQK